MVNPSAADTVYSFLEIALAANAGFKNDKNNAKIIHDNNLTLEEYIDLYITKY